jgi:hypothetical protein
VAQQTELNEMKKGITNLKNKYMIKHLTILVYGILITASSNAQNNTFPSSGNVGIGTTSPTYKLDVYAPVNNWKARFQGPDGYITIGPANSDWAHIYTDRPNFIFNAGVYSSTGVFSSYSTADLTLQTGGVNRFIISNASGNVGIGTSSPTAKLEVNQVGGGSGQNQGIKIWAGNNLNYFGNTQLSFCWGGGGGAYSHAIKSRHNAASISGNAFDFYVWQPGDPINGEGSLNVMTLNGANVGIGTSSPQTKLDLGDLRLGLISNFPAEGSISEGVWGNYIVGDANTAQRLRLGVSNDFYTRAEIFLDNSNRTDGTISFKTINGGTGALTRMFINGDGNVGIGTASPGIKLDIVGAGGTNTDLRVNGRIQTGDALNFGGMWVSSTGLFMGQMNASALGFYNNGWRLIADANGNVGIGTVSPDEKLTVNGTIHTKEVKVDMSVPGPDYVFEKDYDLLSLTELENYIQQNKHLPEVPSAKEMEKDGLNLKEMNLILLKKVEELTLHLLSQEKKIVTLQNEVQTLKNK